jgi:hypothetical protein
VWANSLSKHSIRWHLTAHSARGPQITPRNSPVGWCPLAFLSCLRLFFDFPQGTLWLGRRFLCPIGGTTPTIRRRP